MATRKTKQANPKPSQEHKELMELKAKVAKLEKQNEKLQTQPKPAVDTNHTMNFFRKFGITFFVTVCVVTFMLFNVANWVKASVISNEGFLEITVPLIEQPAVQQVLQQEITNALFENIDIETELNNALPENVQFLAGPLTGQIESFTYDKVGEVLASDQLKLVWGTTLETVHSTLIDYIYNENADGVISVNDVYAAASSKLSDTQVSFLLNKQLPDQIGNITIGEVYWLDDARSYVSIIEKLPVVFLLTSVISFIIALALSVKRRTTTIVTVVLLFIVMLSTVAALVIGRDYAANQAQPQYSAAVSEVFAVITNPLMARAQGYMAVFGLIILVFIATSKSQAAIKTRSFLSVYTNKAVYAITPSFDYPEWMQWLVDNRTTISWTLFAVLFVVLGFRIPPDYNQVISGFITSLVITIIFYLATMVLNTAKQKQK